MPHEIERKFLIKNYPSELTNSPSHTILQGYVYIEDEFELRLRMKGDKYYQTIKKGGGLKRDEFEIEITNAQFDKLWQLTEGRRIEKLRYEIGYKKSIIELDVYGGHLKNLITAEIEFKSEEESIAFKPPAWFSEEITADERYKNKNLALYGIPKNIK